MSNSKTIDNYMLVNNQCRTTDQGEIYQAQHIKTNELVTIKVIKLDNFVNKIHIREAVLNEIQLLKKMPEQVKSVVKIHKMLKSANHIYLVYDFYETSLSQFLANGAETSPQEALNLFKRIVTAYEDINDLRIIHSSIQPLNIYLHYGEIKFDEYGLSRTFEKITKVRIQENQYEHYAPEMIKYKLPSVKTDIYQLGLVFKKILGKNSNYHFQDILDGLLQREPELRFDLEELKNYLKKYDRPSFQEQPMFNKPNQKIIDDNLSENYNSMQGISETFGKQDINQLQKNTQSQIEIKPPQEQNFIQVRSSEDNPRQNMVEKNLNFMRNEVSIKFQEQKFSTQDKNKEQYIQEALKILVKERNKYQFVFSLIKQVIQLGMVPEQIIVGLVTDMISMSVQQNQQLQEKLLYNSQKLFQLFKDNKLMDHFKFSEAQKTFLNQIKIELKEMQQFQSSFSFLTQKYNSNILNLDIHLEELDVTKQFNITASKYLKNVFEHLKINKYQLHFIYQHVNNMLNAKQIDQFFELYVDKNIYTIDSQVYCQNIKKSSSGQIVEMITKRISQS